MGWKDFLQQDNEWEKKRQKEREQNFANLNKQEEARQEFNRNLPGRPPLPGPNSNVNKGWEGFAKIVSPITKTMKFIDESIAKNPFLNNINVTAGETVLGKGNLAPDATGYKHSRNTGNKLADFASSTIGNIGGLASTPVDFSGKGTLAGNNLLNFSDDIAEYGARKIATKLPPLPLPQALKNIGTATMRGAIDGGIGDVANAMRFDEDPKEIAKQGLQGALGGALMFGTGKAIGEGTNAIRKGLDLPKIDSMDFRAETQYKMDNPPKPRAKGEFKIKNPGIDNAYAEYEGAVQAIQNYWGHWKLDNAEIVLGAEELGIDLNGILRKMQEAEKPYNFRPLAERARMGQVAGVIDNVPLEKAKPKYELPTIDNLKKKLNSPNPNLPLPPKIDNSFEAFMERSKLPEKFNKNIPLEADLNPTRQLDVKVNDNIPKDIKGLEYAKGTEFEGMGTRQLNSLNAKLDREYNELLNAGLEDRAQELVPKMKAVKDILGIEDLNDDILMWKDKNMLSYQRETFDRNLEDMIGKEKAQKYIQTYSDPLKASEAERMRYLNDIRSKVKSFGIKAGSKESELVQKFGEGEISLPQLQGLTKDWKKVVETTDFLRKYYDETLDAMNVVLERNGYAPIAKRPDYFPHQGELEGLLEKIGIKSDALPTEISGRTAVFKPGKTFFGNALRRKGDKTVYDAIRGFDNYIEGASKQIHLTDDIQRLRGFENEVRNIARDSNHLSNFVSYLNQYTNNIAGKKHDLDRSGESTVGRVFYKITNTIKKQVGSNMVGANVSSNLTNFIPLTQSIATTDKKSVAKGLAETLGDLLSHSNDFANKSDFLTRRFGSDKLAKTKWEKAGGAISSVFEGIDKFTSTFVVRSKYNELTSKGMNPKQAIKLADNYAARLMTDKSLGQLPTIFNTKTIGMLTQFQSEVNNQASFLLKDLKGLKKTGEISNSLGSAIVQMSLYSWIFNTAFENLTGRRPAIDPIEMILNSTDKEKTFEEKILKVNEAILDQLPGTSLVTGGRIPLSAPLEGVGNIGKGIWDVTFGKGSKTLAKGATQLLPYIAPSGGNQLQKTVKGLTALKGKGVYTSPLNISKEELKYPVLPSMPNAVRGALFGESAFPEAKEYYDKKRKPLSEKQTSEYNKKIQLDYDPIEVYGKIIKEREDKAKKLKENKNKK